MTYEEALKEVEKRDEEFKEFTQDLEGEYNIYDLSKILKTHGCPDNVHSIFHKDYVGFRLYESGDVFKLIPVGVFAMSPDIFKTMQEIPKSEPDPNEWEIRSYKDDYDW